MHTWGPYQAATVIAEVNVTAIDLQIRDDGNMAKRLESTDRLNIAFEYSRCALVFLCSCLCEPYW